MAFAAAFSPTFLPASSAQRPCELLIGDHAACGEGGGGDGAGVGEPSALLLPPPAYGFDGTASSSTPVRLSPSNSPRTPFQFAPLLAVRKEQAASGGGAQLPGGKEPELSPEERLASALETLAVLREASRSLCALGRRLAPPPPLEPRPSAGDLGIGGLASAGAPGASAPPSSSGSFVGEGRGVLFRRRPAGSLCAFRDFEGGQVCGCGLDDDEEADTADDEDGDDAVDFAVKVSEWRPSSSSSSPDGAGRRSSASAAIGGGLRRAATDSLVSPRRYSASAPSSPPMQSSEPPHISGSTVALSSEVLSSLGFRSSSTLETAASDVDMAPGESRRRPRGYKRRKAKMYLTAAYTKIEGKLSQLGQQAPCVEGALTLVGAISQEDVRRLREALQAVLLQLCEPLAQIQRISLDPLPVEGLGGPGSPSGVPGGGGEDQGSAPSSARVVFRYRISPADPNDVDPLRETLLLEAESGGARSMLPLLCDLLCAEGLSTPRHLRIRVSVFGFAM